MRPQEHFGRQRRPEGVRAPEAMALETIRLVLGVNHVTALLNNHRNLVQVGR